MTITIFGCTQSDKKKKNHDCEPLGANHICAMLKHYYISLRIGGHFCSLTFLDRGAQYISL